MILRAANIVCHTVFGMVMTMEKTNTLVKLCRNAVYHFVNYSTVWLPTQRSLAKRKRSRTFLPFPSFVATQLDFTVKSCNGQSNISEQPFLPFTLCLNRGSFAIKITINVPQYHVQCLGI